MQITVIEFYQKLDKKQQKTFRENVRVLSGINYAKFFYRLKNNSWTRSELIVINRIIAGTGYKVGKEECDVYEQIKPIHLEGWLVKKPLMQYLTVQTL